MIATMTAPVAATQPKEYYLDGRTIRLVSAEAMGYIAAAQRKCRSGNTMVLLKFAAEMAEGNDDVLMDLFTYGRFEFDLPTKELCELIRERMSIPSILKAEGRAICIDASKYLSRTGRSHRRH
jgi:hypothetical protein